MAVFDGIRAVVLGSGLAVDMATMVLSDNGADVVRVEPPGGDARREVAGWRMWNRGARSVVLDLDQAADRATAVGLLRQVDVVLDGSVPGALGSEFDYDALSAGNRGLVHCRLTAFGPTGPLSWLPAYDGVVEARAGTYLDLSNWMHREGPTFRARPNPSYAAANVAIQSISAALLVREEDGQGQHIDTSLYQALLCYDFGSALRRQSELGRLDPPMPDMGAGFEPFLPYLVARCGDGQWMQMTNNTGRLFRHWMDVIGLEWIWSDDRYSGAPMRFGDPADKQELARMILAQMATKTFDEWLEIFLAEGLTGDRFLTTQQALDHPQVIHNGTVLAIDDPEVGPTLQLGPLVRFADSPSEVGRPAPLLDADRDDVLAWSASPAAPPAGTDSGSLEATSADGPLAGLLILDFAAWLAGPFGTSLMADMGARVIKIETPSGEDSRPGTLGRARTFQGKESMALDLKSPEGREAIEKLVAQADGIMHNMRGDAAARLGIDYETAKALNPEIVYLYAGSYGSTGPGAGRAAFHPMMGALSGGVLRQLGRGNEPPNADVPLEPEQVFDYALTMSRANETSPDITGAMGVASAMAMAFLHRRRTGRGQYLETTMLASNLYICSEDALRYEGKPALREVDGNLRGTDALNRLYQSADGWVFLCCPSQAEWQRFCVMADRPQWVEDERYVDAASRLRFDDELIAETALALSARTADEWEKLGAEARVACVHADASGGDDFFLEHPQSVANGFVIEDSHPGVGTFRRAGAAATFSLTPSTVHISHQFGQDGPAILAELGYDEPTIQKWADSGVLVTPQSQATAG